MGFIIYLLEIKAKNAKRPKLEYAQRLWNPWIPKCNSLVAKACPAKSRIIPNPPRKSKKAKETGLIKQPSSSSLAVYSNFSRCDAD
jgi:hypothetical protein